MPRRKAPAPQRDQGKFEDRFLAGGADAAEGEAAGQLWDEWQAAGSEEESEEEARRPAKRRRKLQKRGRGAAAAAAAGADEDGSLSVVVAAVPPDEQQWRFAELPISWRAAAGSSRRQAAAEMLEEGQVLFTLQHTSGGDDDDGGSGGGSIAVHCQSGGAWQGSVAAPDAAVAEALLLLLRSGHLSCSLAGQPGASNGGSKSSALALSLADKVASDAAEHPEEQQQRQWHRQLLAVVRWLLPHLDPEAELEQLEQQARQAQQTQQAQHGSAADRSAELLSSPLCSPRKADAAAADWPGSPRSPGGGSAAGAGAAAAFDAAELYAAVKPSGREPELPAGATSATLLPTLRQYQARAAQWMVRRERGGNSATMAEAEAVVGAAAAGAGQKSRVSVAIKDETEEQQEGCDAVQPPLHPLWREVPCSSASGSTGARGSNGRGSKGSGGASSGSCFYFNPYNGRIALERFPADSEVRGGILSDEMGLGKTVELLACITAHRYTGPPPVFADPRAHKRRRRSRIECLCGATGAPEDEDDYAGLWLQCDACDAWMHAACVGLKRAPPGEFVCGACQRAAAAAAVTQDCGATLVVCPTPIVHQWREEIMRHIRPGALKLVLYEGQPQPGAGRTAKVVTPAELAAADIVLTTYDVLRRDINHAPDGQGQGHNLRRRKKYEVMPTPLTRLRWWRVCLDEAQMVESSTAKAAEMALKLDTVHRWCVTGTPLSRGLEDLFGLLAFLQAAPYSNRFWWHKAVQQPYEAGSRAARAHLLALLKPSLGGLLWRSSKADVAHELGLPPQHHHLTRLQLSAIERHFYRRQHHDCVDKAKAALSSSLLAAATAAAAAQDGIETVEPSIGGAGAVAAAAAAAAEGGGSRDSDPAGLEAAAAALADEAAEQRPAAAAGVAGRAAVAFEDRALSRREEASLLHPLLRLRQACCHPQVGGGGIKAHTHTRAPMTMGEVLEVMLAKARVEAEDAQRLLLASLNGLAGLLLLQGLPADAVRAYREALATTERNSAHIRADKLQQLHTLHNLADLLGPDGRGVPGVAPTLRDAQLAQQAQELREEYLAESAARLAAAAGELADVEQHAQRTKAPLAQAAGGPAAAAELLEGWYMRAVALFGEHGREHHTQRAVAERIKEQLKEETMYLRSVSQNATTIASKFRDLYGLELALKQELRELSRTQGEAMEELQRLQSACVAPPASLVELAATCSRCRAETAVAGRVCLHCKLEERFWQWEGRAFALYSKAREGVGAVSAGDAIRQAQQAALNRVGRGGLGEAAADAGLMPGAGGGTLGEEEEAAHHLMLGAGRREDAAVATQIVRRPGDAENALRLLLHQLRLLRVPEAAAAEKELLLVAGKAHLELMEQGRRLYLKARALSLTQRARLYALDELEQCTMRIKLLSDNELRLKEGEEIYRIYDHEVPVRSTELSNDKAAAEAELNGKLGTLRYLESIKAREAARAAAAAAAAAAAGAAGEAAAAEGAAEAGDDPAGGAAQLTVSRRAAEEAGKEQHSGSPTGGKAAAAATAADAGGRAPGAAAAAAAAGAGKPAGGTVEADICPVCHDELGQELVMLPCAHRMCCKCSMMLQERLPASLPQPSRRIACPTCRAPAKVSDLVYIDARLASPHKAGGSGSSAAGGGEEEEAIVVQGSYGTKLEAVVRRLLWLTRRDATARVLVFSTWKDVLELVSHALSANCLPHLYPRSSKKFEAAVAEFRSGHEAALAAAGQAGSSKAAAAGRAGGGSAVAAAAAQHPQVLLLLVKQGANGLNLTEAQHVVLAEPLLDPAVEAQAVGRVDRIGQTRSTHVHRFVVERTIEENVHRLCQQRAAAMDLSAASVKRAGGSKEQGALTVRDVALLLRQPEEEGAAEEEEPPAELQQQQQQQQHAAEAVSPRERAAAAAAARAEAAAAAAALGAP